MLDFFKLDISKKSDTYKRRQSILFLLDILIVIFSYSFSSILTMLNQDNIKIIIPLFIHIALNSISIIIFKGYSSLWNKSADREFIQMIIATSIYQIPLAFIVNNIGYNFTLVFYVVNTLLILLGTCTSRVVYRGIRKALIYMNIDKYENHKKVLIIGAGSAGRLIIKELYENPQLQKKPIGIIDDNTNKLNKKIYNIPIIGTCKEIKNIVKDYEVDEIIFSIANIENKRKKEIISTCKECECVVKTIPGIYEIIDGKVDVKKIRDVEIEDLLGRDIVNININEISDYLENKTILVTGG